jgi:chromosome segregation ATPase
MTAHPLDTDRLFAHLGRLAFEAAEASLALERSESVRARLETAAEARNDERNELVEKCRLMRERTAALTEQIVERDKADEIRAADNRRQKADIKALKSIASQRDNDAAALSRRLAVATAEIKQLRSELATMTRARDKAITERDRAVFAAQGIE